MFDWDEGNIGKPKDEIVGEQSEQKERQIIRGSAQFCFRR